MSGIKNSKGYSILAFYTSHVSYIKPLGSLKRRLLLEELLKLSNDGITDLGSGGLAANITSASASLDDVADSLLDNASLGEHAEGVLHHHGDGEDGSNGVDDALSGNVGGGT